MDRTIAEHFEITWKDFVIRVRAQINKRCKDKLPSYSVMQAILEDCKLDWEVSDNKYGRWLINFAEEYPEQAELMKQVLVKDMQFSPRTEKQGLPYAVKVAAPVVGAVAGFSVSHFCFHAPMLVQAACTVVPAVAAPPVVKAIDTQICRKNIAEETNAYIEQLEKYYLSVKGILETC